RRPPAPRPGRRGARVPAVVDGPARRRSGPRPARAGPPAAAAPAARRRGRARQYRRGTSGRDPMSELLARVCALFLTPAPRVGAGPSARAAPVPSVALLCRPEDALPTAGALALSLARESRIGRALVGVWRAGSGVA